MNENTPAPINEKPKSGKNELYEIIRFTIIAFLIVIPIRMYIAQPFIVSGDSMVPTFRNGEYLIIDEVSYKFGEPERGDVIVFRFPNDTSRFFIKRIIGLPGETIVINGNSVEIVKKDGSKIKLQEEYVKENFSSQTNKKLQDGEYFVMGDNRRASSDSRAWGILGEDYIVGKALIRIFPISGLGLYPGNIDIDTLENRD